MTTPTTTPAPAATPDPPRRRHRFAQISVRTRITVFLALITAVAMAASGLLVYALESARISRVVNEQINQELAEFSTLEEKGIDPATAKPFQDVRVLLDTFLVRNVPDDDEMLVAYTKGDPLERTRNRYGEEVLADPTYLALFPDLAREGGTEKFDSDQFGEVWVTAVPVRNNRTQGALVILNFLDDEHSELNQTMRTYSIVALLSLGLITALAAWLSGRLLAPLRTLRDTAEDITGTDLSRRIPETGNDDITALTRTVNTMLTRLEAAFAGQRRFLDSAGHELRTPLTVLRGHLELLDTGSPEEVAETRDLLLDEVDRMSGLVGDLMVLAKARRPDFLTPEPVSLEPFTHTLLAKARGLGDRDWQLDGAAEVVVAVDEQRITQAVLQLVDNAVKHTDEGDVVAIGSAYDDSAARMWVRDTGDGVPAADRDRIFGRFERGSTRDGDEGFGLGLSIVSVIADGHGGRVWVEDAPPRGSRFVISLPTRERTPTWPES